MSNTRFVRAATLDCVLDVVGEIEGVQLRSLPPFTTLLVQTVNSMYRLVIADGPEVYVQGGAYFSDPTPAHLDGATFGNCLKLGWIGVGMPVQIRSADLCIVTSPVRVIITEKPSLSVVH